jgi:hypothetical protein
MYYVLYKKLCGEGLGSYEDDTYWTNCWAGFINLEKAKEFKNKLEEKNPYHLYKDIILTETYI